MSRGQEADAGWMSGPKARLGELDWGMQSKGWLNVWWLGVKAIGRAELAGHDQGVEPRGARRVPGPPNHPVKFSLYLYIYTHNMNYRFLFGQNKLSIQVKI
jgi:hypothetical protein